MIVNKEKSVKDAVDVFKDIVNFSERSNVTVPDNIILLGGVALSYFGIRGNFSDIDAYSSSVDSLYNISKELMGSWREKYGEDFDIDFTNNKTMWTDKFNIGNLNQCEKICFIKNKKGIPVLSVSVLDQETIFILKSYADRDKDHDDLKKIFARSSKGKVIKKINDMALFNNGHQNYTIIESTLSSVQELTLSLITGEDLMKLKNVDEETLLSISSEFGVEEELLNLLNVKFFKPKNGIKNKF